MSGRLVRKLLVWVAGVLAFLVLLVIVTLSFLLGTESGGKTLVAVLNRESIPVSVQSYSGRLGSRFELQGVRVMAEPVTADLERVVVEWHPLELVQRRLRIDRVLVDGVNVVVVESTAAAEPTEAPADSLPAEFELPIDVLLGELRIDNLTVAAPGGVRVSDARMSAAGAPDDYRVEVGAALVTPDVETIRIDLAATGDMQHAEIEDLRVRALDGSVRVLGSIHWLPAIAWRVSAEVEDVAPGSLLEDREALPGSISLRLDCEGSVDGGEPRALIGVEAIRGTLRGHALDGHVSAGVRGTHVDVEDVALDWGTIGLRVQGQIAETLDLTLELALPDLGIVLPEASGSLRVAGTLAGSRTAPRVQATVQADSLAFQEQRVVKIAADVDADLAVDGRFDIELAASDVHAGGQVVDELGMRLRGTKVEHELDLDVSSPIADLTLALGGGLADSTTWQGVIRTVALSTATAGDWRLAEPAVVTGSPTVVLLDRFCLESRGASICVAGGRDAAGAIDAVVGAVAVPFALIQPFLPAGWSLAGSLDGDLRAAIAADGALDAELGFETRGGALTVALGNTTEVIEFATSIDGRAGEGGTRAALKLDLTRGGGSHLGTVDARVELPMFASLADTSSAQPVSASVQLLFPDLSAVAIVPGLLPEGWSLAGGVAGDLRAAIAADGALDAELGFETRGGALTVALGDTTEVIEFATSIDGRAGEGGTRATLKLDLTRGGGSRFGTVDAAVELPELVSLADTSLAQPVSASLQALFPDLSPAALIVPALSNIAGDLAVDVQGGGALREPNVLAEVSLRGAQVDIADLGLELRDMGLHLTADEAQSVTLQGSVRSGSGVLTLTSESAMGEVIAARVQVVGERFEVMNTPEIHALVSPDIEVTVDGTNVKVEGRVHVPLTRVELKQVPPSAVRVSSDVVFVEDEEETVEPPFAVTANMRVVLGDSVSFKGFGFSSNLEGDLVVIEQPGSRTTGTGELRVRNGRFKAYGQDLTIGKQGDGESTPRDPGRVTFAGGPIDNPGLDMKAIREAKDGVIAGLHIQGTAKRPEITLFSVPSMSQSDVLSYIMLGRKLSDGGGGDTDLVASAATSLGLKGGNLLARQLGSKVGLDEARIETDGSLEEASFVAGKYLSPKLYVSHGIGLFDRISTFRVRYLLNPSWTVQAETGKGTGADVLYRLER